MAKFPELEDLIAAAATSAADNHPNPLREGCPPQGTFAQLIRRGRPPSSELRSHLLACSPCFREYRDALDSIRTANSERFSGRAKRFFALATAATIAAAVGVLFFRGAVPAPSSTAVRENQGGEARSPAPSVTVRPPQSLQSFRIDLTRPPNLRQVPDGPPVVNATITVPQRLVELVLDLPKGSPKTTYKVTVVDAFANVMKTVTVATTTGTITTVLDFSDLAAGTVRLCVAYADEVPDCRPLTIAPADRPAGTSGS